MTLKHQLLVILFQLGCILLMAQKTEKGSSPTRPWVNPLPSPFVPNDIDNDTSQYFVFKKYHFFGKWEFMARANYFLKVNESMDEENLKLIPTLLGVPADVKSVRKNVNNISFKASGPGKKKFGGRFYYEDSIAETHTKEGLLANTSNYSAQIFQKKLEGYILTSSHDTIMFNFFNDFDLENNPLNGNSVINIPGNTIIIQPLVNYSKNTNSRGSFAGFQMLQGNSIIAGAVVGKDFLGSQEFRYWISKDLESSTTEVIAGVMFILVCFL